MLASWDRLDRVAIYPCQNPAVRHQTGISKEDCETAAWAVDHAGQRFRGAAAINQALSQAFNHPLPMRLYNLPGVKWLQDLVYTLAARWRGRLPGVTPYCLRHPEECDERSQ